MRTRWRIGCGVQPRVIALRLDVSHLGTTDETSDAGQFHRDRLVVGLLGFRGAGSITRRIASASRLGPHRLHQVVGGVQLEGVDRMFVVGGDEDDLRPIGESGQHPGQLDAVQARHLDVAEDHVGRLLGQQFQRGSRAAGRPHRPDSPILLQQIGQLQAGGLLVIHHQCAQPTQSGRVLHVHGGTLRRLRAGGSDRPTRQSK